MALLGTAFIVVMAVMAVVGVLLAWYVENRIDDGGVWWRRLLIGFVWLFAKVLEKGAIAAVWILALASLYIGANELWPWCNP